MSQRQDSVPAFTWGLKQSHVLRLSQNELGEGMVQVHGELGVCESFKVLQSSRETLGTPRVDGRPACPPALSCQSSTIFLVSQT